jgi:hypothetical protein
MAMPHLEVAGILHKEVCGRSRERSKVVDALAAVGFVVTCAQLVALMGSNLVSL